MLLLLFVLVVVVALLIVIPGWRERIVEGFKNLTDDWLIAFLRRTSRFAADLTDDGRAEQGRWREQRMRNLQGLALRARTRHRISEKQ
jgi:predicted PurR-regulated permease PerM